MTFTVNGKIYKTMKDCVWEMNPAKTDANADKIFRFCDHNVKEFRDYKWAFYRDTSTKINSVRQKYNRTKFHKNN